MGRQLTRRRLKWKVKFLLVFLVFVFFFAYAEANIRAAVRGIAENQMKIIGTEMMNDAVNEVLQQQEDISTLVKVHYNQNQQVGSIETDSMELNRLRTEITEQLLLQIRQMEVVDLPISLGSLTGNDLLTARGPEIHFQIYPNGNLTSKIISEFDSAGINQTRHRMILQLSMNVVCTIPFYRNQVTLNSEFVMAETIIVGEIPEYYTQVISEGKETLEQTDYYSSRAKTFENGAEQES